MNFLYAITALLLSLFALPAVNPDAPVVMIKKTYKIQDDSKLFLEGSSNINEFTCNCKQSFPPQTLIIRENMEGHELEFDHSLISITTRKLDCGQKVMNNDMYETLKAGKYPEILIELRKVRPRAGGQLVSQDDWGHIEAVSDITIAGIKKEVILAVEARKTGPHQYQFRSSKVLKMSDFGLKPPSPLLGLIKVNDDITINLDLAVLVRDA